MHGYIRSLAATLLALSLGAASGGVLADAGEVVFVFGSGSVYRVDGSQESLKLGLRLDQGDRVVTQVNGRIQIRMADGGLIALRPGSEILIEAFQFTAQDEGAGTQEGDDQSFFRLLKGGLRSITGVVGQENKEAYRMETPVATIGIRGTDYIVYLCDQVCADQGILAKGLHAAVNKGGIRITNEAGSIDLDEGESGHVADSDSVPVAGTDSRILMDQVDDLQMPFPQAVLYPSGAGAGSVISGPKSSYEVQPRLVQTSETLGSTAISVSSSIPGSVAGVSTGSLAASSAAAGIPFAIGGSTGSDSDSAT
ncbi:MAG: FecR family protein, partial [Gammaproteobacteria bacterium]|nr:FecR family protein [Gammaproteobacteria bacterium]